MAGTPAPNSHRKQSGGPAPFPGPSRAFENPPSKRARSFSEATVPDPEDPFGAHAEFTADDLEELDILASQALSQCPVAPGNLSSTHNVHQLDGLSNSPMRKNRENAPVKDNFELEVLQIQYKELKEKLKSMEEEVLIKNGEIKILRDSLHQTESVLEEQRRSHFHLEQEKTQALSEKEKEFSKKLQSLQSELQFKDAEMNELRTKLQSNERTNKLAAPSISHVSPRKGSSVVIKSEACSPHVGKSTFPTKESFSANMPLSYSCQTEEGYKFLVEQEVSDNKTHSLRGNPMKQDVQQKILADSWMQKSNTQGSILINLLLKQPLVPGSSLGLCHLLSSCSEVPTGTLLQPPGLSSTLAGISGLRTISSRDGSFSLSALREAQNLAFTGLNLVARSESSHDGDLGKGSRRVFPLCQLPGAVHLLPLVQFFIGLHCQALQDLAPTKSGAPGDSPTHTSCVSPGVETSPEDSICHLESFSVASLSILQHLVCHSGAVVCLLLSGMGTDAAAREGNLVPTCTDTISASREDAHDQKQHPLLKMLLQLVAFSSTASGSPVCCRCYHSASAQSCHCRVCSWLLSCSQFWWIMTALHSSCAPIPKAAFSCGCTCTLHQGLTKWPQRNSGSSWNKRWCGSWPSCVCRTLPPEASALTASAT
nr:ATR-interacting protein isoform X3 [Peromyscus maniculatus bairdii]